MSVRDATPADAAAVAAIYNESIEAGDSTMDVSPRSAADVRRQLAGFTAREGILVLDDAGDVVGWGIVKRYSDRPGYRFCCETSVYIRRGLVRRGYGTRIQRALLDRCRQWDYHHVVAKIWATNEASLILHAKLGFETVGIQREIGYMHDRWQDVVIMQCIL